MHPAPVTPDHNRRRSLRIPLRQSARLVLNNQRQVQGITRDLSREGTFLEVARHDLPLLGKGAAGALHVEMMGLRMVMECQVARHLCRDGVGLRLFNNQRDLLGFAILQFLLRNPGVVPFQ